MDWRTELCQKWITGLAEGKRKKKRRKQCIIEKLFTLPSDMTDKIDKVSENQNDTPWTVHQEKHKCVL